MGEQLGLSALDGGREAFDSSSVPAYPLVRVAIRQNQAGDLEGLVDDDLVATDIELEPVRRAVIAAAAKVAAKRIGPVRAIRVRGEAPDASVFNLVVTAAGEVYDLTDALTAGSASKASGGTRKGRTRPAGRGVSPLFVLVFIVLPLVLFGAPVALLVVKHFSATKVVAAPPAPKPTQLPVIAPSPYAAVAPWSVKLGETGATATGAGLAADSHRAYVVRDGGTTIAAYAASSGIRQWRFKGLKDAVVTGPALTDVDDHQVLAAATARQLVLLSPSTGHKVGEWKLPTSAAGVQVTATGPVVLADSSHARIVVHGSLVSRVLPATGTPVAPGPGGSLVVVGSAGQVWSVTSNSLAGHSRPLPAPANATFVGVAGWTGPQLILAYSDATQSGTNGNLLASFDTSSWTQRWATKSLPAVYGTVDVTGGRAFPLVSAPSGGWGIYGTTAVDLSTGNTAALTADWQTSSIDDELAFGTGQGRVLVATPAGVTTASLGAAQAPTALQLVAPQAAGDTRGYVVTTAGGSQQILFALRGPGTVGPAAPVSTATAEVTP